MYSPSWITQNFFIVKLLFIIVLVGIVKQIKTKKARFGLILASTGIVWTAVTRTVEAYGVSGPWGVFGSPGLLLFFIGLSLAGYSLLRSQEFSVIGKSLIYIFIFSFLGSISAILLFNVLGRDTAANQISSVVSNLFLIAEGAGWIFIGFQLRKQSFAAKLHHLVRP